MTNDAIEAAGGPALVVDDKLGDERAVLRTMLDYQRVVLLRKSWGLSDEQLHTALPPSSLTIGGLLNHMAMVENNWFERRFLGNGYSEPWASAPWDEDWDWEFTTASAMTGDELRARLSASIDHSRQIEASADLDAVAADRGRDDEQWNMRWILVHMIEEYARHNGHADLIRESIDGATGD